MIDILLVVAGVVLVIWGASKLTGGAVGVAERLRVPQIVIGLTIVSVGTSAPELFVSLMSALNDTPDMAVGNIVGSNIFNVLVIAGVAAVVCPISIGRDTVRRDLPVSIVASLVFVAMCIDGEVGRLDAAALMAGFVAYMVYTVRVGMRGAAEAEGVASRPMPLWKSALFVVAGLAALIFGGDIFVDGASGVAHSLGVSDALIGLTIVAGGTSLPELATSIVAARKGNSDIAIGNVIGSNVFNILMILGLTGAVSPMRISGVTAVDMGVLVLSGFLLWMFCYTKHTVSRWEGAVMAAAYGGYLFHLVTA